jgi:hypothetical protein
VHILAAESARAKTATNLQLPKKVADLRNEMNQWAHDSNEEITSEHGGFHDNDGSWIPLQDSLLKAYGGDKEIKIFTYMYDVTVHVHAPESCIHIQTYQGSTAEAQEYNILHTSGWKDWYKDDKGNFVRSWGGDHWQFIKLNDCRKIPSSKGSGGSTAQAASTAKTAVKHLLDNPKRRLDFGNDNDDQLSAATVDATEDKYPAYVHFMLREVSGTKTFVRNPIPVHITGMHNNLRMVTLKGMHFLEDCFGETFLKVYPSSVQQLLYAFPDLDETHRSFFMCLGIGANLDPYTLQHTFRSHARRLPKDRIGQDVIQTLEPGIVVNWRVLQWCWPAELDAFRIHVLDSNTMFVLESPGSHQKHDMILKFEKKQYTLLHAIEGATAQKLRQEVPSTELTLRHESTQQLRCQNMRTFDVFFDKDCFVSAALQGSEPSKDDLVSMWKEATAAAGLEYNDRLFRIRVRFRV